MKKIITFLLCVSLLLLNIPTAFASDSTIKNVMGDDEVWAQFTVCWDEALGDMLDIHPYYQLHLAYYMTLSADELGQLSEYLNSARTYYEEMINDPAEYKWNWVDGYGIYHEQTEWIDIPYKGKLEAMRSALAMWEAFDFTTAKLIPLSEALKHQNIGADLSAWFVERYPDVENSTDGDSLMFAEDSTTLRRAMMDETGFENWPIQ